MGLGCAAVECARFLLKTAPLPVYTLVMKEPPAPLPVADEPLPGSCFCGNLRRATRTVTRVYEEEFRSVGFTGSTQYTVLRTVGRAETMCQRDLGRILGVDETT